MPTTRSASKKQNHQFTQQQTGINRLPPEILSRIFVFCDRIWSPDIEEGQFPLQDRIPRVCRLWRKVALDTSALWSRITFSELSEYPRAALFLSRSGSTAPLDIEIDMTEPFWDETEEGTLEECEERAKEAFKFIVSHGGAASRWQRFWIQTDTYLALLAAMDFLRKSRMTSLQYLEMSFFGPAEFYEEDHDAYYDDINSSPKRMFDNSPPQLRTVKLVRVPNAYLFGHAVHPQFVGLTRLELGFAYFQPSLEDMHKLLVASSSTLVTLCLDSGEVSGGYPKPRSKASSKALAKVTFPKLQALSFAVITFPKWDLGVLKMIDAPDLKVLRIQVDNLQERDPSYFKMLELLAHGPDKKNPRAYFPTITHLSYDIMGDLTEDLRMLLGGCPNIGSLSLPSAPYLTALANQPWLAPRLVRLRVRTDTMAGLKKVVAARHKAGIPLKVVELNDEPASRDLKLLEKYVENITVSEIYDERERVDPTSW